MVGIRTNNHYFPRRRLARNSIMKQLLFLFLFTTGLTAQLENPVSVHTGNVPGARAGEVIHIPVIASMDPEWFIYSIYKTSDGPIPTAINVSGKAPSPTCSASALNLYAIIFFTTLPATSVRRKSRPL